MRVRARAARALWGPVAADGSRVSARWLGALLAALPLLVMAGVAAVDFIAGPKVGFLPVLSLGPALAAVSLRPAPTALVGTAALALCAVLGTYDQEITHRRGAIALATVAGVTVAGVIASAGRRRWELELADVRSVAEVAQRVLLRPVPESISGVSAAVRYISATASARIGGDLYEIVTTTAGVRLIVGDVQGKGLTAVQTAATVLGAFREAAHDAPDLPDIAARIERSLARQAPDEEFVTAVMAQVSPDASKIGILNCGHPAPLLLGATSARFIEPAEPALPLGLADLAESSRELTTLAFHPGEQVLFYTDGVSEARNRSGQFYPLEPRAGLLAGGDPVGVLDRLCDDLIRHVGHALEDDAAMLVIRRDPPPAGGPAPRPA